METNPFVDVTSQTGLVKLGNGIFVGSNGLTKKGAGTLIFQSSLNTFTGGLTIKAAKMRGESSEGMLCSAKEMGIAEDAEGLLILPVKTKFEVRYG